MGTSGVISIQFSSSKSVSWDYGCAGIGPNLPITTPLDKVGQVTMSTSSFCLSMPRMMLPTSNGKRTSVRLLICWRDMFSFTGVVNDQTTISQTKSSSDLLVFLPRLGLDLLCCLDRVGPAF